MTISKKIRFETFKRDGFKCAYCGKSPPQVILEIDHVEPRAKGGNDDINNLITACFECNRGKKDIPLSKIPPTLSENLEVLQEQEEQIKEYRKFIKKVEHRIQKDIDDINDVYTNAYPGWMFSDQFRTATLKTFLRLLPKDQIIESVQIAINKFPSDKDKAIPYFCGICWNKIKSKTDPTYEIKKQLIGIWKNQPRGSGYLKKGILDYWLTKHTRDQIAEAMIKTRGIWAELRCVLGDN